MCGPNWQTESIYVPCNRWCFNDKDILRQFQPQRKKKNHLAGVKIRVDYGVDFNATNWSVHKNLSYTTFEHTRYIMTVMLRNQFRKQTKNTAKHLHLNYQALTGTLIRRSSSQSCIFWFTSNLMHFASGLGFKARRVSSGVRDKTMTSINMCV